MAPKFSKLAGKDGQPVEVTRCEVVRESSSPTGWVARGITPRGALVRVPVPGATLDGVALEIPEPDEQRKLAPEATPPEASPVPPAPARRKPREV